MKHIVYPALLVLSTMALGAHAQSMKAGLWEISQKMQSSSGDMEKAMGDMQKEMAAMPPEQRKMMQDMLAKQGVGMGSGQGPMSLKVCMTKDMVDRNELAPQQGDCKSSYAPRAGNTMKISFVCTQPPSSGEGQITFISPEAYTSTMAVSSMRNGKSERMTMDSQGKWLSAECGAIKPVATPKK